MEYTKTILYYTSNKEKPGFERRIRETLLKNCGNLPIISISQKPINLGTNICVGDDIGVSGFNMFRQVLIGCEKATSDFVISAEADCLYPSEYFTYTPPRLDACYRNSNLYVMPDQRAFFFYKEEGATHAQIIGREYYIKRLKELFGDAPMWSEEEKNFPRERHHKLDVFDKIEYYRTENPIVQIKTHRGMRYYTRSSRVPIPSLPYWGDGEIIRRRYIKGENI
jgi:hypothetical protein